MLIPEELWIGEERYDELLDKYFEMDDCRKGDREKLIARMLKEMKDEPLVLEYIGLY